MKMLGNEPVTAASAYYVHDPCLAGAAHEIGDSLCQEMLIARGVNLRSLRQHKHGLSHVKLLFACGLLREVNPCVTRHFLPLFSCFSRRSKPHCSSDTHRKVCHKGPNGQALVSQACNFFPAK